MATRSRNRLLLLVLVALIACLAYLPLVDAPAAAQTTPTPVNVSVIRVHGNIDPGMAAFVRRVLKTAEDSASGVVVIDIRTFGGLLESAIEIRDAIVDARVPTIAFVKDRAHSAGALITLAAEHVAVSQGGTFGSAEPRVVAGFGLQSADSKTISALRAEFESTARLRGRDSQLAAAMVDATIEIPGVVARGDLLNVGGEQAVSLGLADIVATSVEDALAQLGYIPVRVTVHEQSMAERVAGFVSGSPVIAVILLVVGLVGVVVEIATPGFGVPGTVGILALAVFFGGRMIAGLAGWESVVLLVAGFALLLIEVFAIPGFGIAGIVGIVVIFIAIGSVFATVTEALSVIAASLLISVVGLVILARYLSRFDVLGRIVLRTSSTTDAGYVAGPPMDHLLGAIGETETILRPSGTVRIDDRRIDAVSEGEFLPKGVLVEVIDVSGNRVKVRRK